MKYFIQIWQDESGTTAMEYAFITLLIAIAIIASIIVAGHNLSLPFNTVAGNISKASR